jgi:hypothetical protein
MARYPIGKSSYGELKGVMQYVTVKVAADQFNTLAMEWDAEQTNGDRLTPNEGTRSRARQTMLWNRWDTFRRNGTPFANLAAYPFTSIHDELLHGLAVDVGITDKNGNNRAPTPSEFQRIYQLAARRGIVHTGGSFSPPEQWHMQAGFNATVPPLPSPRVAGSTIAPTLIGDIMNTVIVRVTNPKRGGASRLFAANTENLTCMYLKTNDTVLFLRGRGAKVLAGTHSFHILDQYTRVAGVGATK